MNALTVKEWVLKEFTEQRDRIDDFIVMLKIYDNLTDTQILEASKLFQMTNLTVDEIFEQFRERTWED